MKEKEKLLDEMEQMLIGFPLGSKIRYFLFFSNLKKSYRGLALLQNEVKN